MTFDQWEVTVPEVFKSDSLWKVGVYRLALFFADLAWSDVTKLAEDRRMRSLSDQLYRAAGGIASNISEGYSRSFPKDRCRFYEYALGSAREARGWYYQGRFGLPDEVVTHRLDLATRIIRLMLTMLTHERHVIRTTASSIS